MIVCMIPKHKNVRNGDTNYQNLGNFPPYEKLQIDR